MRGSIKIGKDTYQAIYSGSLSRMQTEATTHRRMGYKASVRKGRGTASKEYILYVLPKKPKR